LVHFVSAYDGYVLDFYNAFACFRVVGNADRLNYFGGQADNLCWMFKQLAYAPRPIDVINDAIKTVSFFYNQAKWENPLERNKIVRSIDLRSYSSTSFRSGGANHIMCVPTLDFKHTVAVTGHDHTNISAVFEYYTVQPKLVLEAQRGLANWPNVSGKCGQPPSLDVVLTKLLTVEGDVRRFIAFLKELLCIVPYSSLGENGHLWSFSCALMASLLQHLQAMIDDDMNNSNIVVATIIQKGNDFGFKPDQLLSFGAAIDVEWKRINHLITNQSDDNTLQAFGATLHQVQKELETIQVRIKD